MLEGHSFKNKSPILNRNLLLKPTKKDYIDFSIALKSIDDSSEFFTNFFTSSETKKYKMLENIYNLSLTNEFNINKDFTNKEYSTTNQRKNDRIKKFILQTSNITLTDNDLLNMIKYKNKKDSEIQLFIKYEKTSKKAIVYLIDIYHLVIPTEYQQIGQHRARPENRYQILENKFGKSKCGLEKIAMRDNEKIPQTLAE